MSEEYRVPKFRLPVGVTTVGGPAGEPLVLHLSERSERRVGRERPSDLLNGRQSFLPVSGPDDVSRLLARSALLVLSVPVEAEGGAGEDDAVETDGCCTERVEVLLENGLRLSGTVSYVQPPGRRRLLDYLNGSEGFLALREGEKVHLVNKGRIVHVLPT